MYKLFKPKKGPTIITVPIEGIESMTIMILFKVGSRNETRELRGVSHFIEHMLFKGTKKRPNPKELSESIDKIGASYNAFTGKEYTGYYVKIAASDFDFALDWLSDIVINSNFKKEHLEKERGVILEEMNMYEDTPSQKIEDIFEETIFGDQSAGWDILGTKKSIKKMERQDLIKYKNNFYSRDNCVVVASGKIKNQSKIKEAIVRQFKNLPLKNEGNGSKIKQNQKKANLKIKNKKTDQSHLVLGFRSFDLFDPRRFTLNVISNLLGGGMSSRLFSQVREKRGLAYYISCTTEFYLDSGYLAVHAGLDNNKIAKALKVILAEFEKIKQTKVSQKELKKVKNYIKGHNLISLESSNTRAFFFATQQLLGNKIESLEERLEKIYQVTPTDIQETARQIFSRENLNLAIIGPRDKYDKIEQIIKNYE
ncbi:MAG: hypothetical protein GF347_01150 [Candidatus Moranbacteria bacterium]|nr:hypothetical protein [Candidatus Moranbacteria bacterium]